MNYKIAVNDKLEEKMIHKDIYLDKKINEISVNTITKLSLSNLGNINNLANMNLNVNVNQSN